MSPDAQVQLDGHPSLDPSQILSVIDGVADALLLYDADGVVQWASPSVQRIFGWQPANVVGRSFFLSVPHETDGAVWRRWCAVSAPSWIQRHRSVGADGRRVWIEEAVTVQRDPSGSVAAAVVTARDITADMHAMSALTESETRWRAIAHGAAEVTYLCDGDGSVNWVSDGVTDVTGADPRMVRNTPFGRWLHPADRGNWDRAFQQAIRGTDTRVHVRIRAVGGGHRWWTVSLHRVPGSSLHRVPGSDPDGVAVAGGWWGADELVDHQHLMAALEGAGDWSVQADGDGRITWTSSGVTRHLGRHPEELIGVHVSALVAAEEVQGVIDVLADGARAGWTCSTLHADGTKVPMHLVCMPVAGTDSLARWVVNAHALDA